MVSVSKAEKEAIVEQFPTAHIVRTMKQQSDRHHYYCEEASKVMQFLRELRCKTGGVAPVGSDL